MHGLYDLGLADKPGRPLAVIVFYRAYLLAGDLAPIDALAASLDAKGLNVRAAYAGSLKDADFGSFRCDHASRSEALLSCSTPLPSLRASAMRRHRSKRPALLCCNSLFLDLRRTHGRHRRAAYRKPISPCKSSCRSSTVGCCPSAISFKAEQCEVEGLEFARVAHAPSPDGIEAASSSAAQLGEARHDAALRSQARSHPFRLSRRRRPGRSCGRPRRHRQHRRNSRSAQDRRLRCRA